MHEHSYEHEDAVGVRALPHTLCLRISMYMYACNICQLHWTHWTRTAHWDWAGRSLDRNGRWSKCASHILQSSCHQHLSANMAHIRNVRCELARDRSCRTTALANSLRNNGYANSMRHTHRMCTRLVSLWTFTQYGCECRVHILYGNMAAGDRLTLATRQALRSSGVMYVLEYYSMHVTTELFKSHCWWLDANKMVQRTFRVLTWNCHNRIHILWTNKLHTNHYRIWTHITSGSG